MYRSLRKTKVVVCRSVGKQTLQRQRLKKVVVFSRNHGNSQSQAKIHIQRVGKKKLPKQETRVPSYLSKMHLIPPPVFKLLVFIEYVVVGFMLKVAKSIGFSHSDLLRVPFFHTKLGESFGFVGF